MENPSVTVSFPFGFWTQYRAGRAVVNRTWGTLFGWAFFVGAPLATFLFILCKGRDVSVPTVYGLPGWTLVIGGLLYMLVFVPLIHLLNVWIYRRRNRAIGGVHIYTFTPEGYSASGSFYDTKIKWGATLKAIETKHFILLYISSRWAHCIPKSAMDESALRAIRTILREALGPKARLRAEPEALL